MKTLKEGFFGNIGIGKAALIENWLKEMDIKNYTINGDYTIDVNGNVNLAQKNITELPEYIQFGTLKGSFNISSNPITTLRGCPKEVDNFGCWVCNKLITLEGAPEIVNNAFDCGDCYSLKSLEGAPKKVDGYFYCFRCKNLTSLEGAPEYVGRDFDCRNCNKLKSLEGAPKEVGGYFNCKSCGDKFTEDKVKKYSKVKGRMFV